MLPKDTFFNLPEEKRERIIDTALKEFAQYDYKTASLSRIVEDAGISKGSMYQYFQNKKELYLYLIKKVSDEKLSFINESINPDEKDFFEMYKQINLIAAKFDLSHPIYSGLMFNTMMETTNKELGDVSLQLMRKSDEFIKNFVYQAQMSGQIRKDIELDLIAFLLSRISMAMSEYISHKLNFSYSKIVLEGKGSLPVREEEISEILDELIKFYRTGLDRINKR